MDSLCRVCIDKAIKCTSLNNKIEYSSSLSYYDFLNKCTSINACESDKLPQSLCSVCANSIKTFYSFVKLAEKSDIILREALKNSIATGRYDNREIPFEESTIKESEKIEQESDDVNKEETFHSQTNKNSTESSIDIVDLVKEEPRLTESTSIVNIQDEINEIEKIHTILDRPERRMEEPEDILSYIDRRLASIDAIRIDSQDVTDSQSKCSSKAHRIFSNVKKKKGKTKAKSKDVIKGAPSEPRSIRHSGRLINNRKVSCEQITIRNEKIVGESEAFNKEDSLHCQTSENSTGSSLYILDFVKEEPVVSESTSIVNFENAKINESEKFPSNLDYAERSFEEPIEILSSSCDGDVASIDAGHSDFDDDDVPISLLKRRLIKNEEETDSQKTKIEYGHHSIIGHRSRHQISSEAKHDSVKPDILGPAENSYKCKECDMIFNNREEFRTHCRNHIYGGKHEKPFECETCGKKFRFKAERKSHLRVHINISHACPQCGKVYKTKRNLVSHINQHADKKLVIEKHECEICGKNFSSKQNLTFHMDDHKGITKKCDQCDKIFINSFALNRHMKYHTKPKTFKCENCSKKFSSKQYLNFHMENHKGITKKCEQCDKEFKSSYALSRHMKWHTNPKPFKCKKCRKSFSRKDWYTKHIESCKSVRKSNEEAHGKGDVYKCKECNIVFTNREEFRIHCLNYIKGDTHECNICGKKFAKRIYLNNHLAIHEEKQRYKCSICGKGFNNLPSRWVHMKMHNVEKPFECEICGKRFPLKSIYKMHVRGHKRPQSAKITKKFLLSHDLVGEKPECEICGKKFSTKQYLNVHMENHKGITKKCDQCGKEFKNSVTLSRHMKLHANPKPFQCENCGKSLSRKHWYNKHMEICKL